MQCHDRCAACCIEITISSPIPGMPEVKPAGMACIHLSDDRLCRIYGQPERPLVCDEFKAAQDICGNDAEQAFKRLIMLERETCPD